MGNAAFYFFPQPNGNQLVTIDLGEGLSEMYSDFEWDSNTTVSIAGLQQRSNGMTREIVTIQRDRMIGGEELGHKLMALQNHLDRGHSVMFTADTSKTWFAPVKTKPTGGDTSVEVYDNPFRNLTGNQIPAANDYVVVETMGPGMIQEIKKLSSVSGLSSSLGGNFSCNAMNFSYEKISFARWYRSFACLRRAQNDVGAAIVTNEHGLLWSLNLSLVHDTFTTFSFHPDRGRQTNEWNTDTVPREVQWEIDLNEGQNQTFEWWQQPS